MLLCEVKVNLAIFLPFRKKSYCLINYFKNDKSSPCQCNIRFFICICFMYLWQNFVRVALNTEGWLRNKVLKYHRHIAEHMTIHSGKAQVTTKLPLLFQLHGKAELLNCPWSPPLPISTGWVTVQPRSLHSAATVGRNTWAAWIHVPLTFPPPRGWWGQWCGQSRQLQTTSQCPVLVMSVWALLERPAAYPSQLASPIPFKASSTTVFLAASPALASSILVTQQLVVSSHRVQAPCLPRVDVTWLSN